MSLFLFVGELEVLLLATSQLVTFLLAGANWQLQKFFLSVYLSNFLKRK